MRKTLIGTLLSIAIFTFPFLPRFGFLYGAVSVKALFLLALIDLVVIAWAISLYKRGVPSLQMRNPLIMSLALVLLVQFIAALTGIYFEHSFWGDIARSTGVFFLLHIAIGAVVLAHMLHPADWSNVRRAVIASAGLLAFLTLLSAEGLGFKGTVLWFDFSSRGLTLGNESFAGMYFVLAAILGAIEFVRTKNVRWRWIIGTSIAAIALSPIIFNTGIILGRTSLAEVFQSPQLLLGLTRASSIVFYAFAAFVVGWWIISKIPAVEVRRVLKVVASTVAVAGVLVGSALHMMPGSVVQQALSDKTTVARYMLWESSYSAIEERPLLGWGPENFDRAFEAHFDKRLYEKEGRIEVWFDKAHNVVLDTLTTSGYVGLLSFLILTGAYVFVVMHARKRGSIGEGEQLLLLLLPVAHFAQLQTAFDVVPTYALLALTGGYVISLNGGDKASYTKKQLQTGAVVIGTIAMASLAYHIFYDLPRQASLSGSLSESRAELRIDVINTALSRASDFEGLHRTANLFVESVFAELKDTENPTEVVSQARGYLAQYLGAYERYLDKEPDHYRARMHYAYLLLLDTQWGGDRAKDALRIVESSYDLSPRNPITHALEVMALAYQGDFLGANQALNSLKAISPDITLTKDIETWLQKQERQAPQHSFLIISNL
ncbi:MAG TPA: O-antigen ligase family protein [Candidatus Paceibacterota bacterium]|nr:O-antigen ligase family protein [Candidatus Paceibacterota bacterium]